MKTKIEYKIKVYSKRKHTYPSEIYIAKSISQARTMVNVMKKLDPYANKAIEVLAITTDNGNLVSFKSIFKKE